MFYGLQASLLDILSIYLIGRLGTSMVHVILWYTCAPADTVAFTVYNAAHAGRDTSRDRSVLDQPDFEEATRFIYLELHIVGYSPTYSANPVPLKPAETKSFKDLGPRPTIHFSGDRSYSIMTYGF